MLSIVYVNVGKGDCSFILYNNFRILIDTGDAQNYRNVYQTLKEKEIREIDCLILTHPHTDHTGAYEMLKDQIKIDKVFMTKCMVMKKKENNFRILKVDDVICYKDMKLTVLGPCKQRYKNLNDYSLVIKLEYRNTSFLFMGDATNISENELINRNKSILASDVLKVGHHGKNDSSSEEFIKIVAPRYSIISTDNLENDSIDVIKRLKNIQSEVLTTFQHGTIEVQSDGKKIIII